VPKAVNDLSSMSDFVAWISNDVNPPKLVKFCDETSCRLLPGTEWEEIRSRFAPIELDDADRGKEIDDLVAFNKVVLFTKTYCSYCSEVKSLFRELGQEVATFDLDARSDGLAIQLALNAKTGVATTPQVTLTRLPFTTLRWSLVPPKKGHMLRMLSMLSALLLFLDCRQPTDGVFAGPNSKEAKKCLQQIN